MTNETQHYRGFTITTKPFGIGRDGRPRYTWEYVGNGLSLPINGTSGYRSEKLAMGFAKDYINERTAAIDEVDNHAQPASDNALREALAEYAHTAWSGWMRYMFNNCGGEVDSKLLSTGAAIIPQWAVERWQRQMNTPYANLPESEKESDRADADKMLEILSQFKPIEEQP